MSKADLKKDEEMSFEAMVAQMKNEDGEGSSGASVHSGAAAEDDYEGGSISFEGLLAQMKSEEHAAEPQSPAAVSPPPLLAATAPDPNRRPQQERGGNDTALGGPFH